MQVFKGEITWQLKFIFNDSRKKYMAIIEGARHKISVANKLEINKSEIYMSIHSTTLSIFFYSFSIFQNRVGQYLWSFEIQDIHVSVISDSFFFYSDSA